MSAYLSILGAIILTLATIVIAALVPVVVYGIYQEIRGWR